MAKAKETFTSCCRCARDGVSAAAVSHIGCIAAPVVAGLFGASISGAFMAAAMYVTSPLIAMGATYLLDRRRGQETTPLKLAASASIALVVAMGINAVLGHDHGSGSHHEHHQHMHHSFLEESSICTAVPPAP